MIRQILKRVQDLIESQCTHRIRVMQIDFVATMQKKRLEGGKQANSVEKYKCVVSNFETNLSGYDLRLS